MDFIKSLSSVCQKVFAFLQSREHKIQIHGEHYREHEFEALEVNVNEFYFWQNISVLDYASRERNIFMS